MPELMTLPELADYLRFTRKTIYSLLKQEKIPAIKIGRQWRFDKEQIDRWLQPDTHNQDTGLLVIDDDPSVRKLFETTLQGKGYRIVTTATGSEGINAVTRQRFSLVFLDLKLPDISGVEVFRTIKKNNPTLMVIIITGYPDSELMELAMQQGPFGVMSKPFDDEAIISATDSFLNVPRTRVHT